VEADPMNILTATHKRGSPLRGPVHSAFRSLLYPADAADTPTLAVAHGCFAHPRLDVTHMYELSHGLLEEGRDDALFLRAERLPDGRRTFRVVEGEPLPTSHGQDVYRRAFGTAA
jgi:hypothetical protein